MSPTEEFAKIVKETVPDATLGTSYGMPCYIYKGKGVGSLVETKKHIGFYPMSGRVVSQFKKDLTKYSTSSGTVRFSYGQPLPKNLIKKMILARVKEIESSLKK